MRKKSNVFTLYKVTSPSGKIYVGVTRKSITSRKTDHIYYANKGSSYLFHQAIRDYGESLKWKVIKKFNDWDAANLEEIKYIKKLKSHMSLNGYNMSYGGTGNRTPKTEEEKLKSSLSRKGCVSPNLGKKMSQEQKDKISKAKIGTTNVNRRKKIIDDLGMSFDSITIAANYYYCPRTSITNILTGRAKKLRNGRSFSYLEKGGG